MTVFMKTGIRML